MIKVKLPSKLSPFTVEARHIKGYLFRRVIRIPVEMLPEMRDLIAKFIQKSGERDATVHSIIMKADRLFYAKRDHFCFWTIEKEGKVIGYFFAEIARDEYDQVIVRIHHVYIGPIARKDGLPKEVEAILLHWGRGCGAVAMEFTTGRHPYAMMKKMTNSWNLYTWVLRRCV